MEEFYINAFLHDRPILGSSCAATACTISACTAHTYVLLCWVLSEMSGLPLNDVSTALLSLLQLEHCTAFAPALVDYRVQSAEKETLPPMQQHYLVVCNAITCRSHQAHKLCSRHSLQKSESDRCHASLYER